jgi:regulator of sigma E protease
MLIIIFVAIGLALLVLLHEAGHFLVAKIFGLKVDEFGFGFPPRIGAKKIGETEYSFNWLPFGGFVKISGERGEMELMSGERREESGEAENFSELPRRSPFETSRLFYAQPAWKKSLVILAGVLVNFIIGWLLISTVLAIGTPKALVVSGIEPGSPAAVVGIETGDVVKDYPDYQAFVAFVDAHRGKPIALDLLRNNKEISVSVTPRVVTAPNEGAIGVTLLDAGSLREMPLAALHDGFFDSLSLSTAIFQALGHVVVQLFFHASLVPGVVGPVGIFGVAEETGKIGLIYLLQFVGIISLNLAVVNLIPFPALDGGRFLMIILEKIKGSPVSGKVEAWINGLGFAFLLLLMVLLTVRDVANLW